MTDEDKKDIMLMAIFTVTRDDVKDCARDIGMPVEQITDEVFKMVRDKVSQDLSNWRWVFNSLVKDALSNCGKKAAKPVNHCPLNMTCNDACVWREVGWCGSIGGYSKSQDIVY